jgi:hypothetical protein
MVEDEDNVVLVILTSTSPNPRLALTCSLVYTARYELGSYRASVYERLVLLWDNHVTVSW